METDPLAGMVEAAFREGRAAGLSIGDAAMVVADVVRRKLADELAGGAAPANVVTVQSIVSAQSGEPLVQCRVGFEQWSWAPEEARSHALALLACAEAAVHDAAMFRWLTLGEMSLPAAAAMQAVGGLRRFRGDVAREDWRVPDS